MFTIKVLLQCDCGANIVMNDGTEEEFTNLIAFWRSAHAAHKKSQGPQVS